MIKNDSSANYSQHAHESELGSGFRTFDKYTCLKEGDGMQKYNRDLEEKGRRMFIRVSRLVVEFSPGLNNELCD